eukprot:scaffold325828_cov118-Tisochrysis_lutea.AAC.1
MGLRAGGRARTAEKWVGWAHLCIFWPCAPSLEVSPTGSTAGAKRGTGPNPAMAALRGRNRRAVQ